MRGVWAAAIGIAAYAVCLGAIAPAGMLDTTLNRLSEGRLRLAEARGTLWAGSGQIELRDLAGARGMAERCDWHLDSVSLWPAALNYSVAVASSGRTFPVSLSRSAIELSGAELAIPADVLGFLLPRLAPLGLAGYLDLKVATLSVGPALPVGEASMQWRDAGSALSPIAPLGSYEVSIAAGSAGIRMVLRTLDGPLQLDGDVSLVPGAAAQIRMVARVAAAHRPQLAPLLALISVERSEGHFEFVP
jgi:general secretion pathway protein N